MQMLKKMNVSVLLLITAVLAVGFLCPATATAAEQRLRNTFDHVQTGFPLLGAHAQADCHTCHLQGVFKGTPRQCEYCHTQGSRIAGTFKPSGHPQTTLPCTQCHTNQATWAGARFDHTGVIPGSCANCHNGITATGKPPRHLVTTQACDKCHRTTAWIPALFDHTGVAAGTCETCHVSGGSATPRPGAPHPAAGACDSCHGTTAWLPTKSHTNAAQGQCFTCHNGTIAKGMSNSPTPHIPIDSIAAGWSCDACHTYTANFTYSNFTHNSTQVRAGSLCGSCHSGAYIGMHAFGKNDAGYTHFPVLTGDCKTCHTSYISFKTYNFSHAAQGITLPNTLFNCYQCHNGNHTFGAEKLRGPPGGHNGLPVHGATGNCADTGCHTSLSEWGQKGSNENFRRRFKKK